VRRDIVPWSLAALLAVTLLVVTARHRQLRHDYLEHSRAELRIQRGTYLPGISATAALGEAVTVAQAPEGTRQVLFLLTAACPFCAATLPRWKHIARELAPDEQVDVIALTTDPQNAARQHALAVDLSVPLVSFPDRRTAWLYQAYTVPQTVVIDHEGLVLFVRHGVIGTAEAADSVIAAARPVSP
jgi:peroxiredoxin